MEKPRILSGEELVRKGETKLNAQLPEGSLKDILPNGSWLEQKQIQSALEARKHLIEVDRIQKRGVLSLAEWRDDLNLAEVTQKVGGHWQFMGHNVGKQLFVRPEEALFLMETNCLQLKHNGVTVSLQQAYALLLRSKITLTHYKVYSYLSRIGYKVCRYEKPKETDLGKNKEDLSTEVPNSDITEQLDKETVRNGDNLEISGETHVDNCDNNKECKTESNNDTEAQSCSVNSANIIEKKVVQGVINLENRNEKTATHNSANESNSSKVGEVNEDEVMDISEVSDSSEVMPKNTTENRAVEESINLESENEITHNSGNKSNITKDGEAKEDDEVEVMEITEVSDSSDANRMDFTVTKTGDNTTEKDQQKSKVFKTYCSKILSNLENRKLKPTDPTVLEKHFELVPDFYQKQKVTVRTPDEKFIPKNVFLNKLSYVLNLDQITSMNHKQEMNTIHYSLSEEVNGQHIRRIRDASNSSPYNSWVPPMQQQMPRFPNFQFRPFFPFRSRPFMPFNILFQNIQNSFFQQRFRFNQFPRPPIYSQTPDFIPFNNGNSNDEQNNRRRGLPDKKKQIHLQAIKNLAERVRTLARIGWNSKNIDALKSLIRSFNIRYKMSIRLTNNFEIVNDENIVDTIELDCDDEPPPKKAKVRSKYDENFNGLKKMALKLKQLEESGNATSRCRRAFSKLIKNFNKNYTADVCMDNNFNIFDKSRITLDSSSESDCVIEENTEPKPKGKLVKNPFNIIKRLSQKHESTIGIPSTSNIANNIQIDDNYKELSKIFDKNWLPNENDFGRPEIPTKNSNESAIEAKKMEYLFEFIKNYPHDFENWLDVKITFIRNISQSMMELEDEITSCEDACCIKPIIGPKDHTNMGEVLKKLRIIPTDNEVINATSLEIDFDVYNRDVPNFRKTNRPTPNFRIVCLEESSKIPSGGEVAALHPQDNVPLVFSIVGINSISFLEIDPTPLPVFIPNTGMEF